MPDDLKSHYHDNALYEYTFHISLDPAFVYVNNAKCGCTTAKASLNLWYAAWHRLDLQLADKGQVHNRAGNPLLTPKQVGARAEDVILRDPKFFRFTLLREPLSRVASAYTDKMAWNSQQRQRLNVAAGRPAEAEVPFPLFLSLIGESQALRDIDEHWCLQSRQIAVDLINYDRICLQETLHEDLLALRDLLFPGLALGIYEMRNKSNSSKLLSRMSAGEIGVIREIYAEDFTLYQSVVTARASK